MEHIHNVTANPFDVAGTATRPGQESRESKNLALVLSTATIRGP
jgi:hypothetical protein